MKKFNCMYLFIIFIVVFSFNIEVNAATELTCLYKNGILADKVMLVQNEKGKLIVYKNDKDAGFDDNGWYKSKAVPKWGNGTKIKNGSLNECPKSMSTSKDGKGSLKFYKKKSDGDRELEDSKKETFVPRVNEYESTNGTTYNKKCSDLTDEEKWNLVGGKKYRTSCLYSKSLASGCHIIYVGVDKNNGLHYKNVEPLSVDTTFKSDLDDANVDEIIGTFSGNCPNAVYVNRIENSSTGVGTDSVKSILYFSKKFSAVRYSLDDYDGFKVGTDESLDTDVEINFEKIEIDSCVDLFSDSDELLDLLKLIKNLINIIVPIILIGLGTLDFAQAVFSGNEDGMKKALNKFIKRVIIAVAIFLVPSLLKLILSIANGIWGNIDADLCGLL